MKKEILDENGKIKKEFLPAIYLDTNVLIDYSAASEILHTHPEFYQEELEEFAELSTIIKMILKYSKKMNDLSEIKTDIGFRETNFLLCSSVLSYIELIEWKTSYFIKYIIGKKIGLNKIQKMSKKEIGKLIANIYEKDKNIYYDNISSNSFPYYGALKGIEIFPIKNLNIELDESIILLSQFQIGLADILHIKIANKLGCEYFASFDSDFERIKEIMKDNYGLKLISRSKDLLNTMYPKH